MRPRLHAETSIDPRSTVWRTSGQAWTVTNAQRLVVLDRRLQPMTEFPLPAEASGTHSVSPDASHAALSLAGHVALIDTAGALLWQIPHGLWPEGSNGSTWMTPDGRVWAVVPGPDGPPSPDHCWLLDSADGTLLADYVLDGQFSGSELIGYRGGVLLGLSPGGGDDGSRIYAGYHDAYVTQLIQMPGTDRVLADVHRRGDRYLTTNRDHEDVAVHRLTDGAIAVRRRAEEIFGAEDFIDFQAAFVTDDRVVVRSVLEQQHMVLDAADLQVLGPVEYPDGAARDAVIPAGDGAWITTDWLDGHVQLWTISPTLA